MINDNNSICANLVAHVIAMLLLTTCLKLHGPSFKDKATSNMFVQAPGGIKKYILYLFTTK